VILLRKPHPGKQVVTAGDGNRGDIIQQVFFTAGAKQHLIAVTEHLLGTTDTQQLTLGLALLGYIVDQHHLCPSAIERHGVRDNFNVDQ